MKFPTSWHTVRLGEVILDMQPGFAQAPGDDNTGVAQIRTHNVTPEGQISLEDLKYVSPSDKELEKYMLQKGDVVFNNTNSEEWVGKTALYELDEPLVFSNHMTRIRVQEELVAPEFLARYLHFLWKIGFSKTRAKRWVSQAGIEQRELAAFKVPLPPLSEQKRIVEILKHADALRRQRGEILNESKQLLIALFIEMFGDPNAQHSQYQTRPLGKMCKIIGGGTPSTSRNDYWGGEIPWVSPKDMKDLFVSDAEDHISAKALEESATNLIPAGSVLVVTRSGILKHTFPVAINSVEVTINQDIKAILVPDSLLPEFLVIQLQLFAPRLLAKVRIGATVHNIETEELKRLHLLVPTLEEQMRFVKRFHVLLDIQKASQNVVEQLGDLLEVSSAQAFGGDLTESWREVNQDELEGWLSEHAEQFGKRPTRVKNETFAPAERKTPIRPARRWLMEQMSEVQNQVYLALQEWKGTLIPSADLDDFLSQRPVEHLEDAHDQLRRALNQLAGVGLIAKVSLPTETGEYVTGYRVLREEELSKADDLERLGASF